LLVSLAGAQSPTPMSLEQAVARALESSPHVRSAQAAIEGGEARLRQARANYYPQIGNSGMAKAGLSGALNGLQPVGLPNSPFYRNFADALNFYHPGLDFGRTKHSVAIERKRAQALEADLTVTEASVVLDAVVLFYEVLRARRTLDSVEKLLASRELTVRQARAFYEGQMRSKVDLSLAEADLAEARLAELEAQTAIKGANTRLASLLGDFDAPDYNLADPDLALPAIESLRVLVEETLVKRPELRALEARREGALETVSLARSRRKPKLSMFLSGGWARFNPLTFSNLLAVGTGLTFPLFTFGKLEGAIEEAEARVSLLDHEMEILRRQVRLETQLAHQELERTVLSVPLTDQRRKASREAVRLARARYQEQLGSLVALSLAESLLADSEAASLRAVLDTKTAENRLAYAVGRTLPAGRK
jgi:outer membrane protein TolC